VLLSAASLGIAYFASCSDDVPVDPGDTTPPSTVTDLRVDSVSDSVLALAWTAPGDDGDVGTATQYDIRYSSTSITDATWGTATPVANPPIPAIAGTGQIVRIQQPFRSEVHAALRAADEAGNWSELSNTASAELTEDPPDLGAVLVTATDEMAQVAVTGAAVLIETSPEDFLPTGLYTPAVVESLPAGSVRFVVESPEHETSPAIQAVVLPADTVAVNAELGPFRAILAEMFTFVQTSAGPPAADRLYGLRESNPSRMYVIEWHSLPQFPLGDPRWQDREDFYEQLHLGGADMPGYPTTLFQGLPPLLVGSDPATLDQYDTLVLDRLADCDADCPVALTTEGAIVEPATTIAAHLKWRGGAVPGKLKLRFVILVGGIPGGPGGHIFNFVPRNYEEQAVTLGTPGEIQHFSATLDLNPFSTSTTVDYVVYLQSDQTGEILAASGTY
jgi:hypothetical protein